MLHIAGMGSALGVGFQNEPLNQKPADPNQQQAATPQQPQQQQPQTEGGADMPHGSDILEATSHNLR